MELSLSMKLRVAAAAAVGVLLIGILAWPLARPAEPFGTVRAANLDTTGKAALVALAFACGLAGYFVSWPHGREIGILAVPSGLAIWAVRSGSMAALMQQNPLLGQRQPLLAALKFEPLFWLAIVGVGFAGVFCGQKLVSPAPSGKPPQEPKSQTNTHLRGVAALAAAVFIAQICLGRLAQDVQVPDARLGSVVAQPVIGQVVFGVIVSFGLAAFIVKGLLNARYLWVIVASALVTPVSIVTYARTDVLSHLAQSWPAVFFSNTAVAVLPIQIVALGTLGAIAGYWMGVRYDYWRKHEI